MTKQEVIQQAYGEYWEQVKEFVDENGYCNKKDFTMRPKSLQGIENNNGWIKIESEKDLPKEIIDNGTEVYLSRNKITFIGFFYKAYGGLNYSVHNLDSAPKEIQGIHMDSVKKLNGYQLIIKPKPPIY